MALITKFRGRAPKDQGNTIAFTIITQAHEYEFECQAGGLSAIVMALQTCGEQAVRERTSGPFKALQTETAAPMRSRGQPRLGQTHDGKTLVIQYNTHEGIPVLLSMEKGEAETFAKSLLELAKTARPRQGTQ